jgi:endonuclease YncB( thermonuclease family)
MKPKALVNLLPILILGISIAVFFNQWWQKYQASRPDYDNPAEPQAPSKPNGFPAQSKFGEVKRVLDGDTLVLKSGEKIRLCGIDTPEKAQPLGNQATEKLRSLIAMANNQVIVFLVEQDRYGRTVAELFVKASINSQPEQELFVNYEMVASGMAYHYERYSNSCPNREAIVEGERLAKSKRLGVWVGNDQRPWDYRRQQRRLGNS